MQRMLSGRDPNRPPSGGGRNSRASNLSAISRVAGRVPGEYEAPGDKQDALLPASVMSMLRAGTELGMGDGIGNPSRASQQRHNAGSRMSTTSNTSAYSTQTNRQHRQRPSSSSTARNPTREPMPPMPTGSQYVADTLSPSIMLSSSSPSVPYPKRRDLYSNRSSSMTNSMPQPAFRASNSRSTGNLRSYEHTHHLQTPYGPVPPGRLLYPPQRAASPSWVRKPGSGSRRLQTPTNQGYGHSSGQHPPGQYPSGQYHSGQYPSGQGRSRLPSDASVGYSDGGYNAPQQSHRGAPCDYYSIPGGRDVHPLPHMDSCYQQYVRPLAPNMYPPVEPCRIKRSVKGSASSGSTNMRTDSDTPSSDMGPPATPRDGMSMNPIIRPPGIAMTTGTTNRTGGYRRPNSPPYYDGSEQFDTDEYAEPESEPIPTRLVTQTRTTIVEQNYKIPSGKARAVNSFKTSVETKSFEPVGIAELPASPVGRRITRDLVHQGMGAPSTTGDVESSTSSRSVADHMETTHHTQEGATTCRMVDESSDSAMPPAESEETQHSNMSQTNSGLLESSTIDFAVRYSIPAMTGSGHLNDNMIGPEIVPAAPGSSEKNTDSGISDLLAGYQHTDTKQEDGGIPETEANHKRGAMANSDSERVSSHAQQSSDEQSFKSCTDVLESASPDLVKDAASVGEPVQIISPEPQLPAKDSDARSVQTCNDMEISGRTNSMPPSRLPSSNLDVEFQQHKRPTTGSSSPFRGLRRALGTRRESGFSFSSKLRRNSKRDMNQDSISISGSSSTLSNLQSPAVPPRESSASKEAQRHKAVGSYLIRKAYLPLGKSRKLPSGEEDLAVKSSMETSTDDHEPHGENLISTEDSPFPQILNDIAATEQMLVKQDVHPERQSRNNVVECHSSSRDLRVGLMLVPTVHHHPFSSPVADIPEPSSVYSLQDLSLKCLTHSSPAGVPMSPEHNQRDSLSTTHLSWGGRKPYGVPSTSASEPRLALPSVQEDTTTDLRLPVYKYNPPQRYLHDLKEDSHEDSSLNTSASNLKNSQIRFPYSAGFDVRTSVDDAGMLGRKSYMCSRRASIIEDIRGLPFLEFSEANLYDKFKNALPNDMRFSRASGRALLDVRDVVEGSPESGKSKKAYHTVNGAGRDGILRHSAQSSGVINMSMLRRRYSSKKLIAEIDQVSIPSITQLTQRVGEMFPSLSLVGHREQDKSVDDIVEFPEEQGIMEHAMEEIHHVHPSSQKRSSARLRPMRGSSALMVVDDDVYEEITSKEGGCGSMSDQCVGALDFEVEVGEAGTRAKGKGKLTTRTPTRQLSIVTELQTPSPDVLRLENCTTQDRGHRTSAESTLSSSTGSPGSFVSTPTSTETRPWNSDKNYPWAITTNPAADISLPPQAGLKQSPRPGPSHLRNVLSDATSSTFTCLRTSTTPPHGKVSGFNANRQSHRLSIFGRSGDQAHAVGERYPTSALSPPTAIFRDHLSTCDTSDDEDFTTSRKSNKLTLSKRFSSAARGNTLTYTTPRIVRSKVNPAELASPASGHENSSSTLQDRIGEARAFTSNRHTFRDAQGMPIGAYHRHRIVDSIKRWWHKGEDLIRTISRRSSNRRDVVPGGN